jgi:membrane associated rhomboid family serine protease
MRPKTIKAVAIALTFWVFAQVVAWFYGGKPAAAIISAIVGFVTCIALAAYLIEVDS